MRLTEKYKHDFLGNGYKLIDLVFSELQKPYEPYDKIIKERAKEEQLNNALYKLGQLEDIEEELGIDLITLFKALSCGAWEKRKDNVLNFDDCKLLYKRIQIGSNVHWFSNYGKTWALTKEELL